MPTFKEIDWIEEREGGLFGYEFKWKKKRVKIPTAWRKAYPGSEFNVISRDNFLEFVI